MKKIINNFTLDLDNATKEQFNHCCEQKFVIKAALMPDAHKGYVAPIGAVIITKKYIVPSWVGYDIGCGMIALKFVTKNIVQKVKKNKQKIYDLVNKKVPMGKGKVNHISNISIKTKVEFKKLLQKFQEGEYKKEIFRYIKNKGLSQLGSLGSGNHFIEIGINKKEDELWLIVHSGSRGIGHTVATKYMKEASQKEFKYEETFPIKANSQLGKEYFNILDFALNFAILNRFEIGYKVRNVIRDVLEDQGIELELWANKNHNHIERQTIFEIGDFATKDFYEEFIHRKGATPAKKGERGIIPANMKEGCFLVEGLGNEGFLESSSHGAGRKLSRREARKQITIEDFEKDMQGVVGTINERTIDEAPKAYKDIYLVMEKQKKSVKILKHIKPVINWKGE